MTVGMLWFDNSQAPLEEKIRKAVEYYREKYGRVANVVYVNNLTPVLPTPGPSLKGGGRIEVRQSRQVHPNHFWVGVEVAQ